MIRKIIGRLLSRPPGQARVDALIADGAHSEACGQLQAAIGHYRAAVAEAPTNAAAYLHLGAALDDAGDLEGASQAWEKVLGLHPGHAAAHYNLGRLRLRTGDAAGAQLHLRAALVARPGFADAHVVLSAAQESLGEQEEALASLATALTLRPDLAGARKNLGMLLAGTGRWPECAEALEQYLSACPEDAEARYWLGNAWVHLQRPQEAEAAYREAVRIQPELVAAWCNLGNLLLDRGARKEAATCLERAVAVQPDLADGHVGLGNLHAANRRLDEAAAAYRRALTFAPKLTDAWVNLGNVLKDQGAWREAEAAYRAALDADPRSTEARWALAMAQLPLVRDAEDMLCDVRARFARELDSLQAWLETQPADAGWRAVGVQQPFALAYHDEDNRTLLARYGALCTGRMQGWQSAHVPRNAPRARGGPLRVGVVSPFFRDHSVWHAILHGWFAHLDPARFALQAFCLDTVEDSQTRFARSRAARFEQGHAGLRQWVRAIQDAHPDVLVFPEIGMDPMTLKLASLRLAPRQVASWGHPETTGLPTVDDFLSARGLEPPGAQAHYTERLVALPGLGCAIRPSDPAPAPLDVRALGLDPGTPLLVCPGTPFKYAPEHDGVLAEIARRLGPCQLVFFEYLDGALSRRLRERLARAFDRLGVPADCLRLVPWQAPRTFRALLASANAYLDTLGFSGFNTALQAVEAGLPVVALEGRFLRGRLASGLLRHLGLDELVASDQAGYIDRVVRVASDQGYRETMRRRMAAACAGLYSDLEPIRALERFLDQAL